MFEFKKSCMLHNYLVRVFQFYKNWKENHAPVASHESFIFEIVSGETLFLFTVSDAICKTMAYELAFYPFRTFRQVVKGAQKIRCSRWRVSA